MDTKQITALVAIVHKITQNYIVNANEMAE